MTTLKDVIKGENLPIVEEHRISNSEVVRPQIAMPLYSVSRESIALQRSRLDPTEDLMQITRQYKSIDDMTLDGKLIMGYYLIWCAQTAETWVAHDEACLNMNFIYRDDLEILEVKDFHTAWDWFNERGNKVNYGITTCKKCYLLDNPGNETYEVYSDPNYPSIHYGKSTPQGCLVHSYPNRFHRDITIMQLDKLYSNSSNKEAGRFIAKPMTDAEAIIISDGAWMKDVCASAYTYMDNETVEQCVQGMAPSMLQQAVLIAEINGAYFALRRCMQNNKLNITYYYDNTSILNVFKNKRTEHIAEVKRYKNLLERMDSLGYNINFIELHPKTGEHRDTDNKALMFFHNRCDNLCREIADIVKKDYRTYASIDKKENGKTFKQIKAETVHRKKFRREQRGGTYAS